jgi:di/tricarboxylate transporter
MACDLPARCVLTLGVALEKTGAAAMLSSLLISTAGAWATYRDGVGILSCDFASDGTMSNTATAALLAPVAISAADTLGVDARPFLFAVTFAASASFMTPVGYQTNTLIYGPGQYKFADFLRVGAPLNIIFWLLATLLIPRFWSF